MMFFLKRHLLVFISVLHILPCFCILSFASPSTSAAAYVLMCAENGEVICSSNPHMKLPMASTTKIMTSLISLEQGTPERIIDVTDKMVAVEGTSMGLLPGDKVTLKSLVCGMLLSSGNDAANTAAISISGNLKDFAALMNRRAKEIGMNNTNFVTPSGLDDKEHYSTAYDMALLACEAVSNPEFKAICSSKNIRTSYGNPPYMRTLSNHNKLLKSYDGAIGVKTGFTKKSGRCLVSAAYRNGVTLVAVTLNDPNDWYDHTKLLDYGFSVTDCVELDNNLDGISLEVVGGDKATVSLRFNENPQFVTNGRNIKREIYIKPFVYAPVKENKIVGKALYYSDGNLIYEAPIVTSDTVEAKISEDVTESDDKKQSSFEKFISYLKNIFS